MNEAPRRWHGLLCAAVLVCMLSWPAFAKGVSPYLPLSTSPLIERDVDRVLLLAGEPPMRRPIPAAVVLDALPEACRIDRPLCERVRRYLAKYQAEVGLTQLQAELAISSGDSDVVMPNALGRTRESHWQVSGAAFYQPSAYLGLNAGAVAYQGRVVPAGTMLSMGTDIAQLDIGFRDHWFSPLSHSSMLISTQAPTMPSVTLSNYRPISPLRLGYEFFTARMSTQEGIEYFNTTTRGKPYLTGLQFLAAPFKGMAISANKVMQYGGGARGGVSFSALRNAIFKNSYSVNAPDGTNGALEFGNQSAGIASTIDFPGRVPFAFSLEYAGEDYLYKNDGNYRLGDTALALKFDFPKLGDRYDFSYEVSEWQNAWYLHHIYPQGASNDGVYIGHWFAEEHRHGDALGGHAHVVTLGAWTDRGNHLQVGYRNLAFVSSFNRQLLPEIPYRHLHELSLRYASRWQGYATAAELQIGRDAFGDRYMRASGSIDFADRLSGRARVNDDADESEGSGTQWFIDSGVNRSNTRRQLAATIPDDVLYPSKGYHFALGVRRPVSERQDLGVRVELDRTDQRRSLLSIRALDYRFRVMPHLALGVFGGVGRLNYGAPAFGWYGGLGAETVKLYGNWDLGFNLRYHDKLSRNRVLANDPPYDPDRPRLHFDVKSTSLYITHAF